MLKFVEPKLNASPGAVAVICTSTAEEQFTTPPPAVPAGIVADWAVTNVFPPPVRAVPAGKLFCEVSSQFLTDTLPVALLPTSFLPVAVIWKETSLIDSSFWAARVWVDMSDWLEAASKIKLKFKDMYNVQINSICTAVFILFYSVLLYFKTYLILN